MGWYEEEMRRLDRMMERHRRQWRMDNLIMCLGFVFIASLLVVGLFLMAGR